MQLSEDWLSERFDHKWLDESDEGAGMYYIKTLGHADDDLALVSANEGTEVMLFPYDYIRYKTTEQVEAVYKAVRGEVLKKAFE